MNELLKWLRATIEGDKARADRATEGEWVYEGGSITNGHPVDQIVDWVYEKADAEHIICQQPRDTIARCEAELAILDGYEEICRDRDKLVACHATLAG